MIEAELKARVPDREALVQLLDKLTAGRPEIYRDTYYDTAERALEARDAELRIRTVETADGTARTVLTYKSAAVDAASGSKPEHETEVVGADAAHAVVRGLGYVPVIAFALPELRRGREGPADARHGRPGPGDRRYVR
ncbi:CYTH domain-containing protein [Streptomyces sp. NPDC048337]|uniref:CYTH domain-containing protein n=1 Tax=Streptomyces sp. NPDC048337 TaxID=3365535 RepID=UPI0037180B3D